MFEMNNFTVRWQEARVKFGDRCGFSAMPFRVCADDGAASSRQAV
jgi:hypothetical protein